MKRSIVVTLLVAAACILTAPGARAAEDTPADLAPLADGDVTTATIHGMQIIVKRVPHAEFVAANLYVRGGARNWSAADAGVEYLGFRVAAGGGTESLPKEAFVRRLDKLGSTLRATTNEDYSVLMLKSLRDAWDGSFALLADAFLHPALPATEIELQRQRQRAELKHEEDVPDLRLNLMAHQLLYKGHPYEHRAIGTLDTVAKLDAAKLRAHLQKLRESGRLLLVVVGDVDAAHVIDGARAAFGALPRGSWRDSPLPKITITGPRLVTVDKKLATNYISSYYLGPGWRDPDFPAAMVATDALHFREFLEVRTKRNLSYAPSAGLTRHSAVPWGLLYVTAVDPKATMRVMLDEARRLGREPMKDDELAGYKSVFLSGFLMNVESTDGQAGLLGTMQLYSGDWRNARKLPDRIRAVSAADVQAFAKKYIHNLQTAYLGDASKVDKTTFEGL
ncbi:MAG TPA: pitrilysin family protein [Polyangia bacterium]|jgi:zinc protease